MSDEPETPDGDDDEQVEHEASDRPLFLNNGKPMTEEGWAQWAYVRDTMFDIPIVQGDKAPNWSMTVDTCTAGCHTRVWLVDDANEERYLVHEVPSFVAQMGGMVDFNGNINPTLTNIEVWKRNAVLN